MNRFAFERALLRCAGAVLGALGAAGAVTTGPASAQGRPAMYNPGLLITRLSVRTWPVAGKWTYRSYVNSPSVMVGSNAQTALSLLFGEGVMTLTTPTPAKVAGTFDMGGGYVLDLSGSVTVTSGVTHVHMAGLGRAGTGTAGWEYDYDGWLNERWPHGVGQIPVIVGSVFRAKPHDGNPAGFVATFMAERQ